MKIITTTLHAHLFFSFRYKLTRLCHLRGSAATTKAGFKSSLNPFWNESEARYCMNLPKTSPSVEYVTGYTSYWDEIFTAIIGEERTFPDYSPTVCVDTKSSDYCWHRRPASHYTKHWLAQQGDRKGCRRTHSFVQYLHAGAHQTQWLALCRLISCSTVSPHFHFFLSKCNFYRVLYSIQNTGSFVLQS